MSREELAIELPSPQQLVSALRAAGVSNNKHIALYGGGAAHISARAFVTLEYLGHRRVSVMDGGIEAWVAERRQTSAAPADVAAGDFVPEINEDVLANAEWIQARLQDLNIALGACTLSSCFYPPRRDPAAGIRRSARTR